MCHSCLINRFFFFLFSSVVVWHLNSIALSLFSIIIFFLSLSNSELLMMMETAWKMAFYANYHQQQCWLNAVHIVDLIASTKISFISSIKQKKIINGLQTTDYWSTRSTMKQNVMKFLISSSKCINKFLCKIHCTFDDHSSISLNYSPTHWVPHRLKFHILF